MAGGEGLFGPGELVKERGNDGFSDSLEGQDFIGIFRGIGSRHGRASRKQTIQKKQENNQNKMFVLTRLAYQCFYIQISNRQQHKSLFPDNTPGTKNFRKMEEESKLFGLYAKDQFQLNKRKKKKGKKEMNWRGQSWVLIISFRIVRF